MSQCVCTTSTVSGSSCRTFFTLDPLPARFKPPASPAAFFTLRTAFCYLRIQSGPGSVMLTFLCFSLLARSQSSCQSFPPRLQRACCAGVKLCRSLLIDQARGEMKTLRLRRPRAESGRLHGHEGCARDATTLHQAQHLGSASCRDEVGVGQATSLRNAELESPTLPANRGAHTLSPRHWSRASCCRPQLQQ